MIDPECGLPNPHKKCIREIFNALICHDNDYHRLTTELYNLSQQRNRELEKIAVKCVKCEKPKCPDDKESGSDFDFKTHIARIEDVKHCFSKQMDALFVNRDEIFASAQQCLIVLISEKYKFKLFHERSIAQLQQTALLAKTPEIASDCQKDIVQLNKLFAEEVLHIKNFQMELQPFIEELERNEKQKFEDNCCFKEYEWLPNAQSLKCVDELAAAVKHKVGSTLRRGLALAHLAKPADKKIFLATYLFDSQQKEDLVKRKMSLFANQD